MTGSLPEYSQRLLEPLIKQALEQALEQDQQVPPELAKPNDA